MCEATRLPVGDTAGMTADEFMDQTLVIWVRDGAGQVSIGWWGNAGQQYRGFSMNPRSFHVRKIVARINPADTSDDGEHPWDFTSEPEVSFETSVSLFADNGNIDSTATLIPNTGEFRQFRIVSAQSTVPGASSGRKYPPGVLFCSAA
jgi:hypothetical protein